MRAAIGVRPGHYRYGSYAAANVPQQIEERDVSNNLARAGQVPTWLYLPAVVRNWSTR